jgi:septum formation protein
MLREKLKNYKIILASGSPRRQQFFRDLDLDFEIRIKEVDEVYPPNLTEEDITDYLAVLKSDAFEGELKENEILVTSDTIVWHRNQALGKPKDYDDAFKMLQSLSNSTHKVITSVCFKTKETLPTRTMRAQPRGLPRPSGSSHGWRNPDHPLTVFRATTAL